METSPMPSQDVHAHSSVWSSEKGDAPAPSSTPSAKGGTSSDDGALRQLERQVRPATTPKRSQSGPREEVPPRVRWVRLDRRKKRVAVRCRPDRPGAHPPPDTSGLASRR